LDQPIFLQPVFQERIWGGSKLRDMYGYEIPSDQTGECWAISAHPNGQSIVKSGRFEGLRLGELWDQHREIFGNYDSDRFPLLTKILDANDDLSVQVHPNDQYAREYENGELGKTECWYVIDCEENAEIIYGHTAKTKEELAQMIKKGEWEQLLRRIKVKPGDFFYVPSGTIHALCSGLVILETQQNSDTTYRVYDYERRDKNGNLRELHLDKSIDVTTVPHTQEKVEPTVVATKDAVITKFVQSEYFTVYKWDVKSQLEQNQNQPFMLVSVIDGEGMLETAKDKWPVKKGDHFIFPYQFGSFNIRGNVEMIVSHP
jgi:mannose-6-phosphate isomerase